MCRGLAGRRPGTPPRRYRGRESSARAPPPPWGAPRSASHRSRPRRSRRDAPWTEHSDGADLVGPARTGAAELLGDVQRLLERGAIDHIETEQLLLGLGERTVDDHGRIAILPQRGGGRCWHQTCHRPEPTFPAELLLYDRELGHDGGVLFLGPGADGVFRMVAKDGVEHRLQVLPAKDEPHRARAYRPPEIIISLNYRQNRRLASPSPPPGGLRVLFGMRRSCSLRPGP